MDSDEIRRLNDEIESAQNEARKLFEEPVRFAQQQIAAIGGFTKFAGDTQLIINQACAPLTSPIDRTLALGTVKLPEEDMALLTGNHSALTALEESAKLLIGEHAAFGILEERAKLLQGIGIESTLSNYDKLTRDITFPVITSDVQRMLDEVKLNAGSVGDSILKMFGSINVPDDIALLMPGNSAAVEQAIKGISSGLNPESWEGFGFPALTDAAKFNDVLVNSLAATAWTSVPNFDKLLEDALSSLSDSYADIFSSLAKEAEIFPSVPDFVVTLPPRDMVIKTEIIASRSLEYNPDRAPIDLADPAYARDDVDQMLAELDLELVSMLDEVYETIAGNTIGRKRHVCASLRELSTHVVHRLSPDGEVQKWNSKTEFYKDGRPVRRLRLMYICRHIANGAFTDYLNKTISMHVELLDTLNEVHAVSPKLDDFQLRLLLTDAIGMLRFLLRTGRYQ